MIAIGGCHIFELTLPLAELWDVWTVIVYTRRILYLDHIIIKDDSAIVISWIAEAMRSTSSYPLIHDIALLLQDYSTNILCHVFGKINFVVDWVASFITNHLDDVLWTHLWVAYVSFHHIFIFNFLECIHSRSIVWILRFIKKKIVINHIWFMLW